MKKFFAFACALCLGVSAFASRAVVPSDADLAAYADSTYTMCIYAEACNDIVLQGSYCGWPNDGAGCLKFKAVEGFDDWYVVTWNDASTDVQAKPVQLAGDGSFNWDYQLAPTSKGTTLVRGIATLEAGNNGTEVDIKAIGAGIVVLALDGGWKNNPCTAVYHTYTFTLVSPDCNDSDYVVPAISGSFNSWAQDAMTLDEVATKARQNQDLPGAVFTYSKRAAEGAEYKFRSSADWGSEWTNQIKEYNATEDSWAVINGGANYVLGTETALSYDFGDPNNYTWEDCGNEPACEAADYTITVVFPAACDSVTPAPAIVGSFAASSWSTFVPMTATANPNEYTVTVNALCTDTYKFADVNLGWDNEIVDANGTGLADMKFESETTISKNYAEGYIWKKCSASSALDEVVAPMSSSKAIINGKLILFRDGKRFNAAGMEIK